MAKRAGVRVGGMIALWTIALGLVALSGGAGRAAAQAVGVPLSEAAEPLITWDAGFAMSRTGLMASLSQVQGAGLERRVRSGAGSLRSDTRAYTHKGVFSLRYLNSAQFGFGGAGLESGVSGDLAVGLRLPVAETHGVVARLGLRGHLLGNQDFYVSGLELPQLQLGYQWLVDETHVEVFGRGALNVLGRFNPDAATRDTGGAVVMGVVAAAGHGPWHMELAWDQLAIEDGFRRALHRFTGETCVTLDPVALCVTGRHERSEALLGFVPVAARITYWGLSMGFGSLARHTGQSAAASQE